MIMQQTFGIRVRLATINVLPVSHDYMGETFNNVDSVKTLQE